VSAELQPVLDHIDKSTNEALDRLFELISIPSVSTDPQYHEACVRAANWCSDYLTDIGFEASVRNTEGQPMVVGHGGEASIGGYPHLLFYGHYDVQPADPLELWSSPPFKPRLAENDKNGSVIVGRGASDDKGQLMTFLEACRSWNIVHGRLPARITVLLEGEEESGSPSLEPFLKRNSEELKANIALVCDTGQWSKVIPAVTTMLRGLAFTEVVVEGPNRDLHSGMFGGAAQNPIHALTKLIAGLHDENGRISIEGFYDGVQNPGAEQLKQWEKLNFDASAFLAEVGLTRPAGEQNRSVLEQLWSRPTLEVNGIYGGYSGPGTKTVIPSKAGAKFSFRLVTGQDPEHILQIFRNHVLNSLPSDCNVEFLHSGGSPAVSFDINSDIVKTASTALQEEFGHEAVMMGCGGSIPIVEAFKTTLGMESLLVGFGLDDDQIHSPNEKYNLSSFKSGRRAWARILSKIASQSATGRN